jgi:hypothetical protein
MKSSSKKLTPKIKSKEKSTRSRATSTSSRLPNRPSFRRRRKLPRVTQRQSSRANNRLLELWLMF